MADLSSDYNKKESYNEKARNKYAAMTKEAKDKLNRRRRETYSRKKLHILDTTEDTNLCPLNNILVGETSHSIDLHQDMMMATQEKFPKRQEKNDRFERISNIVRTPWTLPQTSPCTYCGANRFPYEAPSFCCSNGQIYLAETTPSPILYALFTGRSEIAFEFRRRSRSYNNAFAFTSMGIISDPQSWWAKDGIYALKIIGQVCHFMNPVDGSANIKDMLQLFFLETTEDLDPNLLQSKEMRIDIMNLLVTALAKNPYSIFFKRLQSWGDLKHARIIIRSDSHLDQRNYNLPTADEVAAIWNESDDGHNECERDIRVYTEGGCSHRVKYHYGCYDPLQYPLLFPYGEQGWHTGIKKIKPSTSSASTDRQHCQGHSAIDPSNATSGSAILEHEENSTY